MLSSDVPHIPPELARSAREFFEPLYGRPLNDHDGREIATNVVGAFSLFREWKQRRDRQGPPSPPPAPRYAPKRRSTKSNQE